MDVLSTGGQAEKKQTFSLYLLHFPDFFYSPKFLDLNFFRVFLTLISIGSYLDKRFSVQPV